jgi:lysophospholipase L1-like esterase
MILTRNRFGLHLVLLAATLIQGASLLAQSNHWVGTWATAPMPVANKGTSFAEDTTLRQTVHVSIGGPGFRVVLTNEFGTEPLNVAAAQVSLIDASAPSASIPLTFSGNPGMIIPPGAIAVSDPVAKKLPALSDLAISLYLPAQTINVVTQHGFADETNYEVSGNQLAAAALASPKEINSWRFLKAVEVEAPAAAGAIVAFGDSITDGAASTKNANARWPDVLARRLQADKKTNGFGILNTGIGGNRVLHDGTGPSALARFDRDVIDQAGVRYVIILESINDIGHLARNPTPADPAVTADQLIAGLQQLIIRAHTHGIKIIGATLTPYGGAGYSSPAGETIRQTVNAFIRKPGNFDGVIDFEAATKDPANPSMYLPAYDHGDHLHPSDAGYKAMGDAIDLKLFEK